MTRKSDAKPSHLAVRAVKPCRACGKSFPPSEFLSTDGTLCTPCWLRDERHFDDEHRQQVLKVLGERTQLGVRFGNDRAFAYPEGLDYHLTRLLDSLRRHMVKVRIFLADDHYDAEGDEIREGHLRRWGPLDGVKDDFGLNEDLLGLFRNVADKDCASVMAKEDYARILRIDMFDELLLGDRGPATLWTAPSEVVRRTISNKRQSLDSERRRAKLFLVHAAVAVLIWVALFLPVMRSYFAGETMRMFGWLVAFVVVGFIVAISLAAWEPTPDLSSLRRTRRGS